MSLIGPWGDTGRKASKGFLPLMGAELGRPAEAHAARLRSLAALSGTSPDQVALELCQAAQDREHQPAVRRRGVGPRVHQ